jgi:hypothetical protein
VIVFRRVERGDGSVVSFEDFGDRQVAEAEDRRSA